tara:strand:- start:5 stop:1216 length:1212 start_codon:yes stop_codon:yes gene_type:complete
LKILITHRYYWPDKSSCSNIIHNIANHLSKKHHVDVITSQPSHVFDKPFKYTYKPPKFEIVDNVNVKRLKLPIETYSKFQRIKNAVLLGSEIFIRCLIKRYDIIIVTTTPMVLSAFFSTIASKLTKTKLIYYCMDINPEIGNKISKDFKNLSLYKLLLKMDDWSCKNANLILVHSEDMLNTLRKRYSGKKYNINIMNNFSSQIDKNYEFKKKTQLTIKSKKKLRIVFTGNIGRFQGLETFIDAMSLISHRQDIELLIVGEGVKKKQLIEKTKRKNINVKFIDYQPHKKVKQIIKNSDIGLVSIIPKTYKYAYPSKISTYLEQGKPIICIVEKKSEIVKRMNFYNYGFHVKFGDTYSIAKLLKKLAKDNQWKIKMSQNALKAYNDHFSSKVILNKWSKVINLLK